MVSQSDPSIRDAVGSLPGSFASHSMVYAITVALALLDVNGLTPYRLWQYLKKLEKHYINFISFYLILSYFILSVKLSY